MTDETKPRGTVHVSIEHDGTQRINIDGEVMPTDLVVLTFYLTRTANQMTDALMAQRPGLVRAQSIPQNGN